MATSAPSTAPTSALYLSPTEQIRWDSFVTAFKPLQLNAACNDNPCSVFCPEVECTDIGLIRKLLLRDQQMTGVLKDAYILVFSALIELDLGSSPGHIHANAFTLDPLLQDDCANLKTCHASTLSCTFDASGIQLCAKGYISGPKLPDYTPIYIGVIVPIVFLLLLGVIYYYYRVFTERANAKLRKFHRKHNLDKNGEKDTERKSDSALSVAIVVEPTRVGGGRAGQRRVKSRGDATSKQERRKSWKERISRYCIYVYVLLHLITCSKVLLLDSIQP